MKTNEVELKFGHLVWAAALGALINTGFWVVLYLLLL